MLPNELDEALLPLRFCSAVLANEVSAAAAALLAEFAAEPDAAALALARLLSNWVYPALTLVTKLAGELLELLRLSNTWLSLDPCTSAASADTVDAMLLAEV
jgi:hypothetical protein